MDYNCVAIHIILFLRKIELTHTQLPGEHIYHHDLSKKGTPVFLTKSRMT